ncbi:hypothetical protein NR800_23765 [Corallococcus interemptor]|uniref:hypothetical protein n=1 Tax=Corallococcus interemptor TaxID=2316720 RepID=UPI0035D51523
MPALVAVARSGRYARRIFARLTLSLLGDVLLGLGPICSCQAWAPSCWPEGYAAAFLCVTRRLALVRALPFLILAVDAAVARWPGLGCAVMLLYWAAQFCIAASTRVAHAPATMPISSSSPT